MGNFNWRNLFRMDGGAVLMILCGIVLAIKPDLATAALSFGIGWVLIALGVVTLIAAFAGRMGLGTVVTGGVLLLGGSWLHRNPLMIATVLGLLLGGLLLSQGFGAWRDARVAKRSGHMWLPGMVTAVLLAILGFRLILSPLGLSRLAIRLAGLTMAVCGVTNLLTHKDALTYSRRDNSIIDADE